MLAGVVMIMLILMIFIPTMVLYVQNESRWSVKYHQNTTAFQLAEAGIDRGYRKISESTTTWANGQAGIFPSGYGFNASYGDLYGGCYAISITSGPDEEQVTILAIGKEKKEKEVRAIQAVYDNSTVGDTAIRGQSGVTISGSNTQVHWGAIVSPKSVAMNGRTFPQVWSAGSIDLDANGSTPPNCDSPNCLQWHSYDPNIPADPGIDTSAFLNAAISSGTFYSGNRCWGKNSGTACGVSCDTICSDSTSCATGRTYYVEGALCVEGKIFVQGTLFVAGNVTLPNGLAGAATRNAVLPQKAWQQYGSSWTAYTDANWDPTEPVSFPGLTSSYSSPEGTTVSLDKVMVDGFFYVGGNLTQSGGAGQTKIIGAAYVAGNVTVTPNNFFVYYSESAGSYIKPTNIILSRQSWKDLPGRAWPSTLTCP
ncbi:MAG: hypothetical protein A3J74_09295 [Elusimicrobia bacterium RIFCSPHIGHO2_02_FULL_57_9]|nr:MAG: hypothetical protein A3J74_09295 [Elusimicrobia bacterium RIFCSPHIGHO2_02_FULL_57_9]